MELTVCGCGLRMCITFLVESKFEVLKAVGL